MPTCPDPYSMIETTGDLSYEVACKMDLSSTKERGNNSPAPPKFRPHAQAREAECSALSATGRRPPPQRHTEPRSGEGVWGIRPPRF